MEPAASGTDPVEELYGDYLRDESNYGGRAEAVFFPVTEADVAAILKDAREMGMDVTVSAGRTGITGGAVPEGGWLMSLEKMDGFLGLSYDPDSDTYLLRVQPGARLSQVQASAVARDFPGSADWDEDSKSALDRLQAGGKRYFYAPDPTETDSCLGGNAACNASGARTYRYGPTRDHIRSLRVMLSDGTAIELRRGAPAKYEGGGKVLQIGSVPPREVVLPEIRWPAVKNASGYCLGKHSETIDLFIGSEGTLGVIVEMELRLIPAPDHVGEVLLLLDCEQTAFDLPEILEDTAVTISSLEYFCPRALAFLDRHGRLAGLDIPVAGNPGMCALLIEIESGEGGLEPQLRALTEQLDRWNFKPIDTRVALDPAGLERFRVLRHSLPETINEVIAGVKTDHPGVSKLGMDFAVPRARLPEMVQGYHSALGPLGLDYVLFGHIGNSHVHVNIIPRDQKEYDTGRKAYRELARKAVDLGGTVSAEHGIGKLKKDLLLMMYGEEDVAKMMFVKEALDPTWTLGQGTLFFMRGSIGECGK